MKGYVEPGFKKEAFNCPYCEVYAHQKWRYRLLMYNSDETIHQESMYDQLRLKGWSTSKCSHCGKISFWHKEQLIYPKSSIAPLPNEDIGNLVKKGISSEVQKALDSVRVIGNNAVHPGELDLKDDIQTAISLFRLINYIVDNQISSKKEIDGIFEGLPQKNIEAIERRDK